MMEKRRLEALKKDRSYSRSAPEPQSDYAVFLHQAGLAKYSEVWASVVLMASSALAVLLATRTSLSTGLQAGLLLLLLLSVILPAFLSGYRRFLFCKSLEGLTSSNQLSGQMVRQELTRLKNSDEVDGELKLNQKFRGREARYLVSGWSCLGAKALSEHENFRTSLEQVLLSFQSKMALASAYLLSLLVCLIAISLFSLKDFFLQAFIVEVSLLLFWRWFDD